MKSEIMYKSELISIMQRKFLQYYIHCQYLHFTVTYTSYTWFPLHIIYCNKYKITQLIAGFHRSARGFISIFHLNSRGRLVQILYCKTSRLFMFPIRGNGSVFTVFYFKMSLFPLHFPY